MAAGRIRIGMSGWTFPPWRGDFYPKGVTQKKELEYASRKVTSIEINGTFYSLQKPDSFQAWHDQTPEDFQFSIKAPQFMTHVLRLKEPAESLATFLASGLFRLGPKLGPILWQLPPNVTLKDDRFEKFFEMLPKTAKEAEKTSKDHSDKIKGRECTEFAGDAGHKIRHAFEFRHESFDDKEFIALAKKHGVAIVNSRDAKKIPLIEDVTTDFVYLRMHGEGAKFKKGYPDEEITELAKKAKAWAKTGLDVYVYFSTDEKEYSPFDAMRLIEAL